MTTNEFLLRLSANTSTSDRVELNAAYRLLADWWSSLSAGQKEKYLKRHPRSRKHNLGKDEAPEPKTEKTPDKEEPAKEVPKAEPKPQVPKSEAPANKPVKGKGAHKAATVPGLDDSHKDALKEYTGSMYLNVNQALRAGKPVPAADRKEMKLVDEAFSKASTTEPIEVYRGVSSGGPYSNLKVGETFSDKAFVSTSTDMDTADNFARGDDKAIMKIQVPKGSKAISVDSLSVFKKGGAAVRSENEILLNRDAKFKVVEIKPAKRGQPKIIVVEYEDA